MEMEAASQQESVSPTPPEEASSSTPPASTGAETPPAQGAGTEGDPAASGLPPAGEVTPPFTPNLKFKVLDQEHEMDKYFQKFIKGPEDEKKFREMYEKAYGLDVVKPKYQELKTKHTELETQYQGIMSDIQDLRTHYQRGDLDSFFEKLKVPFNTVLQYVAEKLQYNELPPEQRQVIDARRNAEKEALEARKHSQSIEQRYAEQMTQATGYMLDLALERADVQSFAEAFQAKTGKSFRDVVIDYGDAAFHTRKVNLTPQQAIKEIMDHYGPFLGTTPQQPQKQAPGVQAQGSGASGGRQEPPVIPNVSGRQTSPSSQKPKSIEDLKKLSKQLSGQA